MQARFLALPDTPTLKWDHPIIMTFFRPTLVVLLSTFNFTYLDTWMSTLTIILMWHFHSLYTRWAFSVFVDRWYRHLVRLPRQQIPKYPRCSICSDIYTCGFIAGSAVKGQSVTQQSSVGVHWSQPGHWYCGRRRGQKGQNGRGTGGSCKPEI